MRAPCAKLARAGHRAAKPRSDGPGTAANCGMQKSLRDIPQQRDWTELDFRIADGCSFYWADFVTTRNLSGGTVSYWPAAPLEKPVLVEFDDTFKLGSSFYGNTKKSARDDLVREYVVASFGPQEFFQE